MGLGSFMGGLTSGLKTGVDVQNSRKYANIYKQYADQNAEEFQMKKNDREKSANSESDTWDNVGKILTFRADGSSAPMGQAATQQPVMMNPDFQRMKGFARGGLVSLLPDEVMAGNAPAAYQVGGLANPPQPAAQSAPAQPQPSERLDPKQELMKQMMNGNLANDPDKLSAVHAAFEQGGMGKTMGPWLERVYTAKKSGMIDGAMQLMRGQVDEAIDSLSRGGIKLEDRPTQVDPKNPRLWRINISGTGEREMDIGDLLQTTLDPEKFLKSQNDRNESEGKRNVSDSAVRKDDSSIKVNNARVGKLGEETRSIRDERKSGGAGGLGGISKLPAPAATAEWLVRNGVHDNYKDAFNAVKTLNDKSPSAARSSLIEAAMKSGASIGEAAKDVDEFLAGTTPAPGGTTRKYNPKTGGFD